MKNTLFFGRLRRAFFVLKFTSVAIKKSQLRVAIPWLICWSSVSSVAKFLPPLSHNFDPFLGRFFEDWTSLSVPLTRRLVIKRHGYSTGNVCISF